MDEKTIMPRHELSILSKAQAWVGPEARWIHQD